MLYIYKTQKNKFKNILYKSTYILLFSTILLSNIEASDVAKIDNYANAIEDILRYYKKVQEPLISRNNNITYVNNNYKGTYNADGYSGVPVIDSGTKLTLNRINELQRDSQVIINPENTLAIFKVINPSDNASLLFIKSLLATNANENINEGISSNKFNDAIFQNDYYKRLTPSDLANETHKFSAIHDLNLAIDDIYNAFHKVGLISTELRKTFFNYAKAYLYTQEYLRSINEMSQLINSYNQHIEYMRTNFKYNTLYEITTSVILNQKNLVELISSSGEIRFKDDFIILPQKLKNSNIDIKKAISVYQVLSVISNHFENLAIHHDKDDTQIKYLENTVLKLIN